MTLEEGDIEFKDVTFCYPQSLGNRVIFHADFLIKRDEITAIIGEPKSGKSSIVNLLKGSYEPFSGKIEICGNSLRKIKLKGFLE